MKWCTASHTQKIKIIKKSCAKQFCSLPNPEGKHDVHCIRQCVIIKDYPSLYGIILFFLISQSLRMMGAAAAARAADLMTDTNDRCLAEGKHHFWYFLIHMAGSGRVMVSGCGSRGFSLWCTAFRMNVMFQRVIEQAPLLAGAVGVLCVALRIWNVRGIPGAAKWCCVSRAWRQLSLWNNDIR